MKKAEYDVKEMKALLKSMSGMYDLVRAVDPIECRVLEFGDDGSISMQKSCYGIWNAEQKCANCSSAVACKTGCHQEKSELFKDKLYKIHSNPIKLKLLDGTFCDAVIELVNIKSAQEETDIVNDRETENKSIHNRVLFDSLTGILKADAFYEQARKTLLENKYSSWKIVMGDIKDFRLFNSLFGEEKCNELLLKTATVLKEIADNGSGICSRLYRDKFAILLPAEKYSEDIFEEAAKAINAAFTTGVYTIRVHFGVYDITNTDIPISVMCERANMAFRKISGNFSSNIAYFDDEIMQKGINEQRIISGFDKALSEGRIRMYLQPLIDEDRKPFGAEALARWFDQEGNNLKIRFTLEHKMYVFMTVVVLFAAFGVAMLSYMINASQMERFDKHITVDAANNYATLTDVEYLKRLKSVVLSDEYQQMRDQAEKNQDETPVIAYLKEEGLWEQYVAERDKMRTYQDNLSEIKYLYIVVWGDKDSKYNMYLLDADDVPVYEIGFYEEREKEFLGVDAHEDIEPAISNGNWGWLCSAYAPVYDSKGELICMVGCDLDMEDVMKDRRLYVLYLIITTIILTIIILAGAVQFIHATVVRPLSRLTEGMKRFAPEEGREYEEVGVIRVDVKGNDEIKDIYEETRSMQIRIIDYINSITQIRKEKERVENVVRDKEQELEAISQKAYRDSLTGVGNKEAYKEKMKELDEGISKGETEFAIVVLDINMLKMVNDTYGHTAGDLYIKGCCRMLCEAFGKSQVYRIGGDEFVAVLTGSDYRDRFAKLDKMKKKFAETEKNKSLDRWFRFSASVGMADFTLEDLDSETVFQRADQLMYEDKQEHKKTR